LLVIKPGNFVVVAVNVFLDLVAIVGHQFEGSLQIFFRRTWASSLPEFLRTFWGTNWS
jgi:hypothetical protein